MSLQASFVDGEFVVSWDLTSLVEDGTVNQQSWDRIEIKQVANDMFASTAITNSALEHDSVKLPAQVPVEYGVAYYATYISADADKVVAKSEPFVPAEDQAGLAAEEKDICEFTITGPTKIVEHNQPTFSIELEWKFTEASPSLGTSDMLCIVPVDRIHEFKDCYYEYAYGYASGKDAGHVELRLGGYVKAGETYQVAYLENTHQFRLGVSDPFTISEDLGVEDETAIKMASQTFNMTSMMQYQLQTQKAKSQATEYNPLLTITPQASKWEALLQEQEAAQKKAQDEAEAEKEQVAEQQKALENDDAQAAPPLEDELLDENAMEAEFLAATKEKPAFLFAGAGISMSAPSSSPSWWALMSQLLQLTFDAMPEEHMRDVQKLHTVDNTRNPEEVMETYYFILQEKLFTLFELLEAGEPNANHKAIAKMAKKGLLKTILTTNFDIFIERALDEEGVPYKVICTDEEYKDYYLNGLDEFAVLKIHGSISRPDTIVAVANHYKTGKGFGGWKATVMQHFVQQYPTIFFGYSGWDFYHANYQKFWESAGQEGGERIFFLKYKGARGGPLISKLVGKHVGSERLVLGEAILPDWACSVLDKGYDPEGAESIMDFHRNVDVDKAKKMVELKRESFMTDWVAKIPKTSMLTLLLEESTRLSDYVKKRQERVKASKGDSDTGPTVGDTSAMSTYVMQLATDMASGKITMEEYMEKQEIATMEMTFASVLLPKETKDELMKLCIELNKTHPILSGPQKTEYGNIFPGYITHIAEKSPNKTASEMLDEAVGYVEKIVEPLREKKDDDKKSAVLHQMYLYQSMILRLEGQDREDMENLFEEFADRAVDEEWSDEVVASKIAKEISPVLSRVAFDQIDTMSIVKSQVRYTMAMAEDDSPTDDVLESAMMVALGLHRQAQHLIGNMHSMDEVMKINQMLASDDTKEIPAAWFDGLLVAMNEPVQPLLDILNKFKAEGKTGKALSPQEVLSTFDLANAEILRHVFQYIGTGYQNELSRGFRGYYPRETMPATVARYLSSIMLEAQKHIEDDRAEQPCLGMLVMLAESVRDIDQMQKAVDTSLQITEGKVTELTPYPIPEALAVGYQEKGDMEKALHYYKLALEGIRTFVMRQKTDAIVLNACLVQAQFDKAAALKMAFEFSPQYSDVQQFGIVGAGRGILVQQCEAWAQELGYASVEEAKSSLGIEEAAEETENEKQEYEDARVAAEEAALAAAKAAEAQRLAEEAEAARIAAEKEAEAQRLAEEAEAARITAEKKAEEERLAEEAEAARIAAEKKAEEERLEAERIAAEKAEEMRLEAEKSAKIAAERAEEKRLESEQAEKEVAHKAEEERLIAKASEQIAGEKADQQEQLLEVNKAESIALEKAQEEQNESDRVQRITAEKAEEDHLATKKAQTVAADKADQRLVDAEESEAIAAEKAEQDQLESKQAELSVAKTAEEDRLAVQEGARLASEQEARREKERKQQEQAKASTDDHDATPPPKKNCLLRAFTGFRRKS